MNREINAISSMCKDHLWDQVYFGGLSANVSNVRVA